MQTKRPTLKIIQPQIIKVNLLSYDNSRNDVQATEVTIKSSP